MRLFSVGMAVLLVCLGFTVCLDMSNLVGYNVTTENQESLETMVNFNIEDVIITSELEIYDFWRDENKIEVSTDCKFVIISITIENNEDRWLAVQSAFDSLIDDEGNKYEIGSLGVYVNGEKTR